MRAILAHETQNILNSRLFLDTCFVTRVPRITIQHCGTEIASHAGSRGNHQKQLLTLIPRKISWCQCCVNISHRDWEAKVNCFCLPSNAEYVLDMANSKACTHSAKLF